jgi:hypothetical protein
MEKKKKLRIKNGEQKYLSDIWWSGPQKTERLSGR